MLIPIIAASLIAAAQPARAPTLADLQWQNRILLLFATEDEQAAVAEQRRSLLADTPALSERQMVVFSVSGETVEPVFGSVQTGESAADLRRRFQVPSEEGFAAILIGLDGGVKWRSDRPVRLDRINAIIDAMPMRRSAL